MALPFVGSVAFATKQATATFESLPAELKSLPLPQRTYITARDGTRIATLFDENRVVVPLSKISPKLIDAMIATEDTRFYEHRGVDVRGALRAAVVNSSAGAVQQGSSTITMQYVRNLLITNARTQEEIELARVRTMTRKLQEMRYALAIEKKLSKDQILAGYLNVVYFGAGAYGAEAASRRYFNTSAEKLTLPQAATLAGLVQRPVGYDPTRHPQISQVRRDVVLDQMAALSYITPSQAADAKDVPLKKTLNSREIPNGCTASKYPFYCDFVVNQIRNDARYGTSVAEREDLLKRGGLVIKTGLDLQAQRSAQRTVDRYIPRKDPSRKAAANAMVQPGTGEVLALAQNRSWGTKGRGKTTYNYAVNAADGGTIGMQAGSTFKIFTIAAALEKGISPREYITGPQRRTFYGGDWGCKGQYYAPYTVNNSTGSGTYNMWSGAAYSVNTFFVELERRAGLCRTVDVAERMGATLANGKPLLRYPSFTLGSMEVSPLTMAAANATIASHGMYCRPHAVTEIADFEGRALYTDNGACRRAVSREVADATTAILTGVIDGSIGGRTGGPMTLGRDAAGKTGTTDSNAAVWFAGFTPQIASAVWVGDPRGGFKYPMQSVTINGRYYAKVYGSALPGPIWRDSMQGALRGMDYEDFDLDAKFGLVQARRGGVNGGNYDGGFERAPKPNKSKNPYYNYDFDYDQFLNGRD